MGIIKTKGIIISENNMGDFDKMLTMLTPGMGKISCVAKGSRRQNSALLASSQFLCFGEYILYKGSQNYSINSCDTIEMFYNLRTDLDKIKYATHITKIIQDVTNENENSYKILQLYLNTLFMFAETEKDKDLILSIFKIKLLCLLGFKPRLDKCTNCGSIEDITSFSIKENGIKCIDCRMQDKSTIQISQSTLASLRFIVNNPSKNIFGFDLKGESLKELKLLSQVYFDQKLEKEYKLTKLW